ncbi:hypothetical protein TSAR_010503 [Trichomalopsis sarcophagae]|uniref:FHA domain-containing protein n=1 Tax=Trichomalopsis sarcophagae TaxID=543379 RepID=A0A232FKF8_9HYME|nr:hypothetical protein TSAR_010503 [Trichomalopsis sarcophagae]
MWLLRDQNGKIRYLKPGKTYNVGRKQADIVLENDSSISRAHATLTTTLKEQTRTSEVSSTCVVKDANSKYGTFIIRNNVQMKVPATGLEVEPNDRVKFGLQQHIFIAEYIRFVSVISRLNADHKKKLKDIMDNIGGIVIDCYDDNCTHLTATTASSTSKIISALIAGIPIVDINYWTSVLNAINADENLPNPDSFTLPLQDKGINTQRVSLKPNPMRKTLFQGKTFVFFSEKTYKEYKKMIKDAGGKIELFKINTKSIQEDLFTDDTIIMQITTESASDELAAFDAMLYDKMQKKKLRMIAETEIPLAIVYVSLSQYCNPKFNFKQLMIRKSFKDTSEVLALDTQDALMSHPGKDGAGQSTASRQVLIPETEDFMLENVSDNENDRATNSRNHKKAKPEELKEKNVNKKLSKPASSEICTMEIEDNLSKDPKFRDKKTVGENCSRNLVKAKPTLDVINDDNFAVLEKQKKAIKRKEDADDRKENKFSKLGFKKSEKKTLDFDLDEMDMEVPKEKIKKEIISQERNEVKHDAKMNNKLFKKIYTNIPVTRIALSDMTVWRPNA